VSDACERGMKVRRAVLGRRHVDQATAVIALGHWEEFRMHVRAAFNNGLTVEEIKEVILQAAVYCGVPAANHAFREAAPIISERTGDDPAG
jgi:4-carboxymuconolactone decarboxylase